MQQDPSANLFSRTLRGIVMLFAYISGLGIFTMIGITVVDVVMGIFRHPIVGAYDLVKLAGAVTMAAALPYTTAVKGHVAIEYFFQKLNKKGRFLLDTIIRLMAMFLFGFAAWRSFIYGNSLKASGQGTLTLQIPVFWVPWVIAVTFILVVLVIFHNLMHPGREMIKP